MNNNRNSLDPNVNTNAVPPFEHLLMTVDAEIRVVNQYLRAELSPISPEYGCDGRRIVPPCQDLFNQISRAETYNDTRNYLHCVPHDRHLISLTMDNRPPVRPKTRQFKPLVFVEYRGPITRGVFLNHTQTTYLNLIQARQITRHIHITNRNKTVRKSRD